MRRANRLSSAALVAFDILALSMATIVTPMLVLKAPVETLGNIPPHVVLMWICLCCWFAASGHYGHRQRLDVEFAQIGLGVLLASLLAVAIPSGTPVDLVDTLLPWLLSLVLILVSRACVRRALYASRLWAIPSVIVGSANQTKAVREALANDWYRGFVVRAEIPLDDDDATAALARVADLAERGSVSHIVFTSDHAATESARLNEIAQTYGLTVGAVAPQPELQAASRLVIDAFFGSSLIVVRGTKPLATAARSAWLKRAMDLIVSSLLLLSLMPVLLLIASLVRRDGGPVLYPSARLGAGGKPFHALKFRTMSVNADDLLAEALERDPSVRNEWQATFKLRNDPRVTSVGRILRRLSLDELPQLINVLRGEMSLVGPRPMLPTEREAYGQAFNLYCQCIPGITGPWQVSGRNNLAYGRRVELNSWYAQNASFWIDLVILARTALVVFRREGAT